MREESSASSMKKLVVRQKCITYDGVRVRQGRKTQKSDFGGAVSIAVGGVRVVIP